MRIRLRALGASLLLVSGVAAAAATPPETLNYQGVLRDATGTPLNGDYPMVFRLEAGGSGDEILVDDQTSGPAGTGIPVTNGLFDVRIGTGVVTDGGGPGVYTSLSQVFRDYNDVSLSIEINGEVLTPSIPISSAPFAHNATHFDGLITDQLLRTDQDDTAFGKVWLAGAPVSSSVGGGPLFVSPSAASPDDTLMGLAVSFQERFRVDAEGDTFMGPNLHMGNGAQLWDNGFGLQVYAGDTDTDDIFLRAGNSSDDGALTIVGDGQMELKAGNGLFTFVDGGGSNEGSLAVTPSNTLLTAGSLDTSILTLIGGNSSSDGYILIRGGDEIAIRPRSGVIEVGSTQGITSAKIHSVSGGLSLKSLDSQLVILDTDMNGNSTVSWWKDGGVFSNDQIAELLENGDFRIAGTYSNSVAFDLAESFLAVEPVEPGDVVRVDPSRGDAVRLTTEAEDASVVGIVSTRPGLLLGGAPFAPESLGEAWGESVRDEYLEHRDELIIQAISERPELRTRAEELLNWVPGGGPPPPPGGEGTSPGTPRGGDTRFELEVELEGLALKRFFQDRFARVALAGRVPVKVDAGYGSVRAGDLLTSSPTAGHAMRADEPKPGTILGKALEGLDAGTGTIRALVMLR